MFIFFELMINVCLLSSLVLGFTSLMMDVSLCWFQTFTWIKLVLSILAHIDQQIRITGSSFQNNIFLLNVCLERDSDGISGSFCISKLLSKHFEKAGIDENIASGQAGKPSMITAIDRPYPVERTQTSNLSHAHQLMERQKPWPINIIISHALDVDLDK